MKLFVKLSTQLIIALSIFFACQQKQVESKIKINIKASNFQSSNIQIGIDDMIALGNSIPLAEAELDTSGSCHLEFELTDPTMAFIKIGEHRSHLYLAPGYKMDIAVDCDDFKKSIKFQGIGAAPNSHLKSINLAYENMFFGEGVNIWSLNPDEYLQKYDSMKNSLIRFHKSHSDSLKISQNIQNTFHKMLDLRLIGQKGNYALANNINEYSDELQENFKIKNESLLFDESLLKLKMYDFAYAWYFYLELEFYRKVWWGMDENEIEKG